MPIIGVICPMDNTPQSFEHCIHCHEHRSKERQCHAPVFVLKSMRDNHIHRRGAGISASTLLSCPRAVAIEDTYDLYETVISGWNKGRGTFVHAMMEADSDPPPWIVREQRLYINYKGLRLTGQPDEVDTRYKVLIDYKSKDNLPLKSDEAHEFQFNFYAYLLRNGYWTETDEKSVYPVIKDEKANIVVDTIAAHYVTWKTKTEKAWKKQAYPLWTDEEMEAVLDERIPALKAWKEDGIMPECDRYIKNAYWTCDCVKHELQLAERGIEI